MAVKFIGLSGPSSSGKTTLAYLLLRRIFPNVVYILYGDDFCKEFDQISTVNGYLDCDGPDAVDFLRMASVLDHMRSHDGQPPEDFKSWQDEVFPGLEEKALRIVPETLMKSLRLQMEVSGLDFSEMKIVILEGFLLFHSQEIRKRLDMMFFFRLSHDVAKERRFSRQGYGVEAKPDEFWKTEDYFEKMVWRCYREQHAFMFQEGEAEGHVNVVACRDAGIKILPGLNRPVAESLTWTTNEIISSAKS